MNEDILRKINHRSGETVPDGYFDSFRSKMKLELPERRWEYDTDDAAGSNQRASWWVKMRPYVYMAAMFAGVWLMMNMFTIFQPERPGDVSDNPQLISAVNNEGFVSEYVAPDVDDYELLDELYDEGFDPEMIMDFE